MLRAASKKTTLSLVCFVAAFVLALCALCIGSAQAWGVTSAEKQAEAQAALASMNSLQAQLEVAVNEAAAAAEERSAAEAESEEAQARIEELNGEIAGVQKNLSSRVRGMYRDGRASMLDCLLGCETFQDFVTHWDLLIHMNKGDIENVLKIRDLRAEQEEQKKVADEQAALAAQKEAEAESAQENIVASFTEMKALYDSLSSEVQAIMQQEYAAQQAAVTQQAAVAAPMVQGVDYAYSSTDSSTGTTTYYDASGNVILQRAYDMIGQASYSYGALSRDYMDCSGFVSYCLSGNYTRLGSTLTFKQWGQVSDPQPGDICTSDGHCGIYIGNDQMIDCSTWGETAIMVRDVEDDMIFVRP